MSATNIQWITIAVLGFGAVFAFFVLVFVFEATVHALRHRDQFAGGGGGFRTPSFAGRRDSSFASSGLAQASAPKIRDPKRDKELAREAARLAAGGMSAETGAGPPAGETRMADMEPGSGAEDFSADHEALYGDVQESMTKGSPASSVAETAPQADDEPEPEPAPWAAAETHAGPAISGDDYPTDEPAVAEREALLESTGADHADHSAPAREWEPEPLMLTEVVDVDAPADEQPLAAQQAPAAMPPLAAERPQPGPAAAAQRAAPLIATRVKIGARDARDRLQFRKAAEARNAASASAGTAPSFERAGRQEPRVTWTTQEQVASEHVMAGNDSSMSRQAEEPGPAVAQAPVQAESRPVAEERPEPVETRPDNENTADAQRAGRVEQPSQPEEEVMADTTRQLKSLRQAEQLGIGPQDGCPLYLRYKSASGIVFDRIVQAVTLEEISGELIMRAYCHRSKAMRRIRLDNIVAAFDLRNRDVSVGGKVVEFISERVPLRDPAEAASARSGGLSPAAAE